MPVEPISAFEYYAATVHGFPCIHEEASTTRVIVISAWAELTDEQRRAYGWEPAPPLPDLQLGMFFPIAQGSNHGEAQTTPPREE